MNGPAKSGGFGVPDFSARVSFFWLKPVKVKRGNGLPYYNVVNRDQNLKKAPGRLARRHHGVDRHALDCATIRYPILQTFQTNLSPLLPILTVRSLPLASSGLVCFASQRKP